MSFGSAEKVHPLTKMDHPKNNANAGAAPTAGMMLRMPVGPSEVRYSEQTVTDAMKLLGIQKYVSIKCLNGEACKSKSAFTCSALLQLDSAATSMPDPGVRWNTLSA